MVQTQDQRDVPIKVKRNGIWSNVCRKDSLELVKADVTRMVPDFTENQGQSKSNDQGVDTHTSKYWNAIQWSASGLFNSVSNTVKSSQETRPRRDVSATRKRMEN